MHGGVEDGDGNRASRRRHDGVAAADASGLGPADHPHAMPDVATGEAPTGGVTLDRVGMSGIQLMVRVADENGEEIALPARADAYVSLDDLRARGIHMSRVYLDLQRRLEREHLDLSLVAAVLRDFVTSQQGLAQRAELRVQFDLPLHRRALLSANRGWRHYPVELRGVLNGDEVVLEQALTVTYSSTCPCSAALSRQATQEAFDRAFGASESIDPAAVRAWLGTQEGMPATPHSQRSTASLRLVPASAQRAPRLSDLVDLVEAALSTPVQTAVKREDEQAFALRNGANLMFCEDAVRRLRYVLEGLSSVADYRVRVDHHESLHPHDATALVVKGVPGGLLP
jgi:GTP cyclohydrolase I